MIYATVDEQGNTWVGYRQDGKGDVEARVTSTDDGETDPVLDLASWLCGVVAGAIVFRKERDEEAVKEARRQARLRKREEAGKA